MALLFFVVVFVQCCRNKHLTMHHVEIVQQLSLVTVVSDYVSVEKCLYRHPADSPLLLTTMHAKLLYFSLAYHYTLVRGSYFLK